jgi:parvulin-like peptidyl-prolyl cis-trans isomerase-like protein
VDERPVSLASFRGYFESNAGRPIAESSPKVVSALFDQFLREELWRREAGLHGADASSDRREAPGVLLSRAGREVLPTEADIDAEYSRHPDRYRRPEEARASRIFVPDRDQAEKARARVVRGEDFARVAREVSRSPDSASGGDMGFVRRGDLPSEFENEIFRLKEGEVSPVMAAEEGFLVFRLEKKEPARELDRDEAAPEIRRTLAREKATAYLARFVEKARREGRLRILEDRLPFVYTGAFGGPN